MKNGTMATPWADPRTGRLYLRRQIPLALRAAFGGRALVKVALGTADPSVARARFATENAMFEAQLADARRRIADGTLVPDAGMLVDRFLRGGDDGQPPARLRRVTLLMVLDLAAVRWMGSVPTQMPPPLEQPAALLDPDLVEAYVWDHYGDDPARVGSWWWGVRWLDEGDGRRPLLDDAVSLLCAFDPASAAFSGDAIAGAVLERADRICPKAIPQDMGLRKRSSASRLRPTMRLRQLFDEWRAGRSPRAQTAAEYLRVVDDFIEFHGDVPASAIDADMLYDFRDALARLPKAMPRADRALPFTERVTRYDAAFPKAEAATVKKAVGGIQALLSFGFQMRWLPRNDGRGVHVEGYSKAGRRQRRSFQDEEMTRLFSAPLFMKPEHWAADRSRFACSTLAWLFLIGATTGARLEEIGQADVADVRTDDAIVYLDIDDHADAAGAARHVKTEQSLRLVPIHDGLVSLGFDRYLAALRAAGHDRLFPDLTPGTHGKRTSTVSQRLNRLIDAAVGDDQRLVFHSLRHSFKALGTDANVSSRVLDQICGHAPVDVAGRYGSEPRIRTIHRELHRIVFPIPWDAIAAAFATIAWDEVVAELPRSEAGRIA